MEHEQKQYKIVCCITVAAPDRRASRHRPAKGRTGYSRTTAALRYLVWCGTPRRGMPHRRPHSVSGPESGIRKTQY